MAEFETLTVSFVNESTKLKNFSKLYTAVPDVVIAASINNVRVFISALNTTSVTISSSDLITGDVFIHVYKV